MEDTLLLAGLEQIQFENQSGEKHQRSDNITGQYIDKLGNIVEGVAGCLVDDGVARLVTCLLVVACQLRRRLLLVKGLLGSLVARLQLLVAWLLKAGC